MERVGNENKIATFEENTLEDLKVDEELRKKNKLSRTFVENIFGMFNNWLTQNPNPDRLILALSSNLLSTVIHFWSKLTQVDLGKRQEDRQDASRKTFPSWSSSSTTKKSAPSQKSELKKVYPLKKVNSRRAPKIE